MPRAAAPVAIRDGLLSVLTTDEVRDGLIPNDDVAVETKLFVFRDANDGRLGNDGSVKSDTLGILLRIEPGLNVSNQLALPARLPATSNPPMVAISKLGISKDVKELTSKNSVPKSVTRDPTSVASLKMSPSPMSAIASNPPLIL
jgi:hypothetical protein